MQDEKVAGIINLLKISDNGRLAKKAVGEALREGPHQTITNMELQGFIGWGQWCELFHYDMKREEIFRTASDVPPGRGPAILRKAASL